MKRSEVPVDRVIGLTAIAVCGVSLMLVRLLWPKTTVKPKENNEIISKQDTSNPDGLFLARYESPEPVMAIHNGSCHCGSLIFRVWAPKKLTAVDYPSKIRFPRISVGLDRFELLSNEDLMSMYPVRINNIPAVHGFCSLCGVNILFATESDPGEISVNVDCLEKNEIENISYSFGNCGIESSSLSEFQSNGASDMNSQWSLSINCVRRIQQTLKLQTSSILNQPELCNYEANVFHSRLAMENPSSSRSGTYFNSHFDPHAYSPKKLSRRSRGDKMFENDEHMNGGDVYGAYRSSETTPNTSVATVSSEETRQVDHNIAALQYIMDEYDYLKSAALSATSAMEDNYRNNRNKIMHERWRREPLSNRIDSFVERDYMLNIDESSSQEHLGSVRAGSLFSDTSNYSESGTSEMELRDEFSHIIKY